VLGLLFLLGSNAGDAFNFLFLLLSIHVALVLPGKVAAVWIAGYFGVVSTIIFFTQGTQGIYAVLFYSVIYLTCGFFGHVLQQAELARDRNQRLVEELKATQRKLQEFAVLEERNRLARDLHDSVKQQVFAISMQLSAARTSMSESDPAHESVREAERLAQQAGAELTALIRELRPPRLESNTLSKAVREHVTEWARQNRIETEIDIDENVSVDFQVEQALFRVLQEALANVARHSKARKAAVALGSEIDTVTLVIEDNGIGFNARKIARGIGLDSMKERLAAVNGKLEVSSRNAKGTRVIARVRRS
jgi:NarL family two-component system sensor histidine kinase LiaS